MERITEQLETNIQRLPDECWSKILSHLTYEGDWESISLTCKKFLSLTNSSRNTLSIFKLNTNILSKLLIRYPNTNKLHISTLVNLSAADLVIAQYGLNLQDLELTFYGRLQTVCLEDLSSILSSKLKVLKLCCSLTNSDLIRIADSFPLLEEIRTQDAAAAAGTASDVAAVTDEGISYLSLKLKRLRIIYLSHKAVSDKSLVLLSSNCAFLEHVTVEYCDGVTETGISFLINNCRQLKALVVSGLLKMTYFGVGGSATYPNNLQTLRFITVDISDEFLYSITKARICLTDLALKSCKGYSFSGISKLLSSYMSLRSLVLWNVKFLTNDQLEDLSPFLRNLTSIKLWQCPLLSDSSFVTITQAFPFLRYLGMSHTYLGREEDIDYSGHDMKLKKNFAINFLDLPSNPYLSTSALNRIFSICPKVEKLNLSEFYGASVKQFDVADILESNKGLLNLDLSYCRLKFSRKEMEFSTLEILDVQFTDIDDEVLVMIGRVCPGLLQLKLACCKDVTKEGVKEVVKSCKRLRFLSLTACMKVDKSIVDWIESNCPSMTRRISI